MGGGTGPSDEEPEDSRDRGQCHRCPGQTGRHAVLLRRVVQIGSHVIAGARFAADRNQYQSANPPVTADPSREMTIKASTSMRVVLMPVAPPASRSCARPRPLEDVAHLHARPVATPRCLDPTTFKLSRDRSIPGHAVGLQLTDQRQ